MQQKQGLGPPDGKQLPDGVWGWVNGKGGVGTGLENRSVGPLACNPSRQIVLYAPSCVGFSRVRRLDVDSQGNTSCERHPERRIQEQPAKE